MTKVWAMALSGLMFAACSNDDIVTENPGGQEGRGALVEVKFIGAHTRADEQRPGTAEEDKIDNATIYVFKSTGEIEQSNSLTIGTNGKATFKVEHPGQDMKFLVAINTNLSLSGVANLADPKPGDYAAVYALISDATAFTKFTLGGAAGNTLTAPTSFPMAGEAIKSIAVATVDDPAPTTPLTINVDRLVSKVAAPAYDPTKFVINISHADIKKDIFKGTGYGDITDVEFEYLGYTFINGLDKSDAFNSASFSNWSTSNKVYQNSTFAADSTYTSVYAGAVAGDMFIAATPGSMAYAYENKPADDPDPNKAIDFYDRTTVYSFIIKGKIKCTFDTTAPGAETEAIRYWRANLIPSDSHTVYRNHIYELTLAGVNSTGYGTPLEAEEEEVSKDGSTVIVSIAVNPWTVKFTEEIL